MKVPQSLLEIAKQSAHPLRMTSERHWQMSVSREAFQPTARNIQEAPLLQASYLTLVAVDNRQNDSGFGLHLLFLLPQDHVLLTVSTQLPETEPTYPAITPVIPAAEWHEREIHDLFGLRPLGISLDPLVLHRDWPRGNHYPMRKDFESSVEIPITEVPHQFRQPHHVGMHQVAVGPIHAGIIEPGHLRFCVTGEQIHQFDAQLFYTHKGIEKMAEGKSIAEALHLAEHVCGLCAFSHSVTFSQAIETLGQVDVPQDILMIRSICLELERLNSHFADLSAICASGGLGFASVHAARFRELLMQQAQQLTGHRFMRGFNAIGGLKKPVSHEALTTLLQVLTKIKREFQDWQNLVLNSDSLLDRLEFAGTLTEEQALTLGTVGPAARGSGIDADLRRDLPYAAYNQVELRIPLHYHGDVSSRTKVRIEEIEESIRLIELWINQLPKESLSQTIWEGRLPPYHASVGLVESAKGGLLHWIMMDAKNRVFRWHVRSASYMNWRGMVTATMGDNIVPDGPLVNKSFNLCYACTDR